MFSPCPFPESSSASMIIQLAIFFRVQLTYLAQGNHVSNDRGTECTDEILA
jgi:hypothetical protein